MTLPSESRNRKTVVPVEHVFDWMGDGVLVLDREAHVVMANRAVAQMLGQPIEALLHVPFEKLLAETELLRVVGATHLLNGRSKEHMQVVFCNAQGGFIPTSVTASPVPKGQMGEDEKAACVLVCRDNLELQELLNESSRWAAAEIERADELAAAKTAAELREQKYMEMGNAQKLESIGQLAAGIAHEINTPIQFIGDNVGFIRKAFDLLIPLVETFESWCADCPDEAGRAAARRQLKRAKVAFLKTEIPKAIQQTTEGIAHVAKIVLAMKDFSHPSSEEKRPTDLHQAIESTVTVARNEWKYVADLEKDFDPALPAVMCHTDAFNQVILNMVVNAAHAVGEVVRERPGEKGLIRISTRHCPPHAEVRIQDTGCGIPEKNLTRIFDPFFTTKEVGKGTGQGLAIAYSVVVKRHGGEIDVSSKEGEGTVFTMKFPLKTPSAETQPPD